MHTHAATIVQAFVQRQLSSIHAARRPLWCAAVLAVMGGQWLSLSRLARGMMGAGSLKAALKRVDRLIGKARMAREAQLIGAALVRSVCQGSGPIVIAVDWSEVAPGGKFVELRAALVHAVALLVAFGLFAAAAAAVEALLPRLDARLELAFRWVELAAAGLLVVPFGLAYDLSRIAAASHGGRRMLRGYLRALWHVLRGLPSLLPLYLAPAGLGVSQVPEASITASAVRLK